MAKRLRKGEEISSISFRKVLEDLLKEHGVVTSSQVENVIEARFGDRFSPDDKRMVNGRPKWKNTLDWAKATMTRQGIIKTRSRQRRKKKETFIVLIRHPNVDDDLLKWVNGKKTKGSFLKLCDSCGSYCPMSHEKCPYCGNKFPPPSRRVIL